VGPHEVLVENLHPHETYVEGLADGRLRFQICGSCASAVFYPRVACNACGSVDLHFSESSGRGAVYATTTVAERDGRYCVCLVDLDEGFRMMSTVVGIVPEDVTIGLRVVFRSEQTAPDQWRAVFESDVNA
jgi:uncharacterized OB-fold protein